MTGPVIGYESAALDGAQRQQAGVAAAGADLSVELAAIVVPPGVFGDVPAVPRFVGCVSGVRDGQLRDVEAETARRSGLAARAARTAELSVELTTGTARVARSAPTMWE